MNRHLPAGFLLLLTLSLLVGCAGLSARPSPSLATLSLYGDLENLDPRGEVLTVWYPASHGDVLLGMLDRFNAANPWGLAVRGERMKDSAAVRARLLSGAPEGKLPDLAILSPGHLAATAVEGLAVELTPYMKSARWGFSGRAEADFFPFVQEVGVLSRPPGRYGFPLALSAGILFYNRGWLRQLGYDHPPRTWEEFREMACAASDPASGIYGYEFPADDRTFIRLLIGWGGRWMDSGETAYAFGGEKGLKALTFLRALLDEGCAMREARREQAEADFGAGRVLFVTSNTLHIPHFQQVAAKRGGLDWSTAPLPASATSPTTDIFGLSWLIPPTTPRRQLAAWLVIRWMNEPSQQAHWASLSGYIPHRRPSPEAQPLLAESPSLSADVLALLELPTVTEPEVIGYEECRKALQVMIGAVTAGEDPASWLTQTAARCNATLRAP